MQMLHEGHHSFEPKMQTNGNPSTYQEIRLHEGGFDTHGRSWFFANYILHAGYDFQ